MTEHKRSKDIVNRWSYIEDTRNVHAQYHESSFSSTSKSGTQNALELIVTLVSTTSFYRNGVCPRNGCHFQYEVTDRREYVLSA